MLKRTALYDAHVAAGARMVDFGGWEMPLHYGSQIEEHHAVRRKAGAFDVSHMRVVDIAGSDARAFLRQLLAADIDRRRPGQAMYSCMLNERGGVVDDLIVYRWGEEVSRFRAVLNAATADRDLQWMKELAYGHALQVDCRSRPELAIIALQGPAAAAVLSRAQPALAAIAAPLPGFYSTWTAAAFVARTGYTGSVTPLESGLAWTVDLDSDRPFVGRPALEQQREAGPSRQLLGLKLLEKGVLRAHQAVQTAHGDGQVTSGSFSPTLQVSIALARLPAQVRIGEAVTVQLRSGTGPAQVVKARFVRHGQPLV